MEMDMVSGTDIVYRYREFSRYSITDMGKYSNYKTTHILNYLYIQGHRA